MGKLDSIFSEREVAADHPLLQYLDEHKPDHVQIGVERPRELFGHKSAKLYIYFGGDEARPPEEYMWDDDLNEGLVARGYPAVSLEKEKLRFNLLLRARLRRVERRHGQGLFNGVLVKVVREEGFAEFQEVEAVLDDVSTNKPHTEGESYEPCRTGIEQILRSVARDLIEKLEYSRPEAEEILAGALAQYLDDRFSVSDRRRLGWT